MDETDRQAGGDRKGLSANVLLRAIAGMLADASLAKTADQPLRCAHFGENHRIADIIDEDISIQAMRSIRLP